MLPRALHGGEPTSGVDPHATMRKEQEVHKYVLLASTELPRLNIDSGCKQNWIYTEIYVQNSLNVLSRGCVAEKKSAANTAERDAALMMPADS